MSSGKQDPILVRLARRPPALEGGIELSVDLHNDHRGAVHLQHGDVAVQLNAAGLSVPYPSGLQRLLSSEPNIELVVVERAPEGLRKAVAEAGINYLDLAGRGRVIAPGLVYVASPRPNYPVGSARSSPFAPKASRVVRVLLSDPGRPWRLSDVAVLSELNPGNVHRALAALVDRGMVERDEDAYVVSDPGSLLEAWADQHQEPRERLWFPYEGDLRDFVRKLIGDLGEHAVVSGELAAEELAPYLPAESAIIHALDPDAFSSLPRPEIRPPIPHLSPRPGQVVVNASDAGDGQFRVVKDGLPLAAPSQVYVDLARDRGRGREAAEHLRESVIGF